MGNETKKETEAIDKIFSTANSDVCAKCKTCCCKNCRHTIGHYELRVECLTSAIVNKRALVLMKQIMDEFGYDEKVGFLTEHGCAVTRGLRSCTCLGYMCDKLKLTKKQRDTVREMIAIIRAKRAYLGYPI
jgi:hypothetical protein